MSIRRLVSTAVVLASLLAFAGIIPATALGQQSGSGSFGFAQAYDFDTNTNVFVEVSTGVSTFRPHTPGALPITIDTGVVEIGFDSFSDHGFGCWLIPKDEVVINSDLGATLTFDSSDPRVSECPGDPVGSAGLAPSGLVVGLEEPLALTVTWTPAGPITSTRTTSKLSCRTFTSISEGTQQSVDSTIAGSAAGTFTDSGGFATRFANGTGNFTVFSGKTQLTTSGSPGCGPF